MKAELSAGAQASMGITLDPASFRVRWTTIILEVTNEKVFVIVILAQPELHATLGPQCMAILGEVALKYLLGDIHNTRYESTLNTPV